MLENGHRKPLEAEDTMLTKVLAIGHSRPMRTAAFRNRSVG